MKKVYYCRLCGQSWPELPAGSIELPHSYRARYIPYRFPHGEVHDIRKKKARSADEIKEQENVK